MSDGSGNYALPNVPAGKDYTVTPSKPSEAHDSSITAFDGSLAARFAANIDPLKGKLEELVFRSENTTARS